jgi:hypothetical protein
MKEVGKMHLPSICYRGSMEQCSIQGYEARLAPPCAYALLDRFVGFRGEVWGVWDVMETHGEKYVR